MEMPLFGVGTFRLKDQQVIDSVVTALDVGYRAIDTAQIYGNEEEVGTAIASSNVSREQIFLTTKIWKDNLGQALLLPSLQDSLRKLKTDYVDLTLIHWPSPDDAVPLKESLDALLEARHRGLTRAIGISNFPIALMQQAIDLIGAENIATNQVELSPYFQNRKVANFAGKHGIHITSYMTLAYGKVLNDPVLEQIARNHNATPAQVALSWAMTLGYAVIPSSTKRANLESNLRSNQVKLSEEEMRQIAALDRNERLTSPQGLAPVWDE